MALAAERFDPEAYVLVVHSAPGTGGRRLWARVRDAITRCADNGAEVTMRAQRVEARLEKTLVAGEVVGDDVRLEVLAGDGLVPAVVAQVLAIAAFVDGRAVIGPVRVVRSSVDLDGLIGLLLDVDRALPVVVASEPFAVTVDDLARDLVGLAHVVALHDGVARELRRRIGEEFGVYGGAVRIYGAPFDPKSDAPGAHSLVLDRAIAAYARDGVPAQQGFTEYLCAGLRPRGSSTLSVTMARAAFAHDTAALVDSLGSAHARAVDLEAQVVHLRGAARRAASLQSDVERLTDELLVAQSALMRLEAGYLDLVGEKDAAVQRAGALEARLRDASGDVLAGMVPAFPRVSSAAAELLAALQDASAEHEGLGATLRSARGEMNALQGRADALLVAMQSGSGTVAEPTSYEPVAWEAWVAARFVGRLVLLPRALDGLKRAQYERIDDVVRALELLGDDYHEVRTRATVDGDVWKRFQQRLSQARLVLSKAASEATLDEYARFYSVPYGDGVRALKWHIKSGAGTADPRWILRIYFFWDSAKKTVVVGWLPSHLPTDAS